MAKLTKKQKKIAEISYDPQKPYSLEEGVNLLKAFPSAGFNESIDLAVRLNVQPKKGEQVRGVVALPHGRGKVPRVLVICTADQEAAATEAGADMVGNASYMEKIKKGWTDFDVLITMPRLMPQVGSLGRVLGPIGKMPSPKTGTVVADPAQAVKEIKAGKISIRSDKQGIVHAGVAVRNFSSKEIVENVLEVVHVIKQLKPATLKGVYIERVHLSSTMGPAVWIDKSKLK